MTRWIFACFVAAGCVSLYLGCGGGSGGSQPDAIFVSATAAGADDSGDCDSSDTPCLTIAGGIARALAAGKPEVRVADGLYTEQVVLEEGIRLLGGYSADTWEREAGATATYIAPPATADGRAVIARDIALPTSLQGFWIMAPNPTDPGASSYGVWIRDCDSSLAISSNNISSGDGAAGSPGSDGTDGTDGTSGQGGLDAVDIVEAFAVDLHGCVDAQHTGAGGSGGVNTCSSQVVDGGNGGWADCPLLTDGSQTDPPNSGEYGMAGQGSGGGAGGQAGRDVYHQIFTCTGYATYGTPGGGAGSDGTSGGNGESGGVPGDPAGTVSSEGFWTGPASMDGLDGTSGSGGGGGGSGGGAWVHDSCSSKGFGSDNIGGSGGGGGAGGCGGAAGQAGGPGGGSFGVFMSFTTPPASLPQLTGNTIFTGKGGSGGDGGTGGAGGAGGMGGPGGAGEESNTLAAWPSFPGGNGGAGGDGGSGSGGGGGYGGPSFGIFIASGGAVADTGTLAADNPIVTDNGSGGAAGGGGYSLGIPGQDGQPGDAGSISLF